MTIEHMEKRLDQIKLAEVDNYIKGLHKGPLKVLKFISKKIFTGPYSINQSHKLAIEYLMENFEEFKKENPIQSSSGVGS